MKNIITFSLLFFVSQTFAQPFYSHWDVGATIGSSHYSGEIANKASFNSLVDELNFQAGVEINYHITKTNTFGFEANFGQWYATDANHLNLYDRNFQGNSNYAFVGLQFKHYFFAKKRWQIKPYLGAGAGGVFHKTIISPNGQITFTDSPKPLPVEPLTPPTQTSGSSFGFTLTGGVTYKIDKKMSIGLEAWLSYYPNDKIDHLVYAIREPDKIASIRVKVAYKLVDLNKRRGLK